ncbi:class I SAM-dependent methyltransferase [Aureivirga sp. CE67]|uniref:class I SAM-dependent methyltransferase n=1 Tax=Aureivirga sp. CE67 TaxID=1788983 RepID=UPI0018C95FF0|nr:class I SAM-dependent methyltransferase [Aureivirga sp. CE67]
MKDTFEIIDKSPITNSELIEFIKCKDYTVSKETFQLMIDEESELLITSPRPKVEVLGSYYESEEYISHTDANTSFVDKIYQRVKKHTLQKKLQLLNSFQTEGKKMLDVGAGTGEFLKVCEEGNWKVFGVEPNEGARDLANNKISESTVKEKIEAYSKEKFDVITMWHVLEHVPNLNEYTEQLKKMLKKDGVLIVAVPNYKSYDADYYKSFWAAYDVPRHLWHFSKKSISMLFAKVNMEVEKVLPMYFDSFYVSLLSEKYKTGSSNLIKAFWIGFVSNLKAISTKEHSSHIYILKNK